VRVVKAREAGASRGRLHRGRPAGRERPLPHRRAAPTLTRLLALRVLERVQRAGAYADVLLHAHLSRSALTAPDRAFATDLVYGTLRWRGRIDYLLSRVLDGDLDKLEPLVANALRLGAYQLLFSERVPASAAVDESVRCVRAAGVERATSLVNAVLRRLAREGAAIPLPDLDADPVAHLRHALSLPEWIARRWLDLFGAEDAAALARASNEAPPLTVRANRLRTDPEALLAELRPRFPEATRCARARDGLLLGRRGNPAEDPAFLAGRFTVQDESSQLVVALLDPRPGERVLDVCAAPGGKTTGIAERVGGPTDDGTAASGGVLAIDRNPRRLGLIRRQMRRLALSNVRLLGRDATRPLDDLPEFGRYARVLVDAPCSGLGTLRRNPDARWRIGPADPARLAEAQRAILANAAAAVRPGGVLVYSTCTLLPEENEAIVESFLKQAKEFAPAPRSRIPGEARVVVGDDGFLRCLPHIHDSDGFFAARLERRP
jgi:16S rRNA (cytosine967-C5)-methyltransferase